VLQTDDGQTDERQTASYDKSGILKSNSLGAQRSAHVSFDLFVTYLDVLVSKQYKYMKSRYS